MPILFYFTAGSLGCREIFETPLPYFKIFNVLHSFFLTAKTDAIFRSSWQVAQNLHCLAAQMKHLMA